MTERCSTPLACPMDHAGGAQSDKWAIQAFTISIVNFHECRGSSAMQQWRVHHEKHGESEQETKLQHPGGVVGILLKSRTATSMHRPHGKLS
jgi:hypothetical protein